MAVNRSDATSKTQERPSSIWFCRWTTRWWPLPKPTSDRVALFAVAKDEGPWLLTWVAHHKALGFGPIAIATNDCSDGTDRLAARLAELGEIVHIDNPAPYSVLNDDDRASIQLTGYDRLSHVVDLTAVDWLGILDLDEFLVLNAPFLAVQNLVAQHPDVDAISLRWRVFGDNQITGYVGADMIERQVMASDHAHDATADYKSIVRAPARFEHNLHLSYRPNGFSHLQKWRRWLISRALKFTRRRISLDGDVLLFPGDRLFRRVRARFRRNLRPYRLGQVNHYAVKTRALFELKKHRGRGNDVSKKRHGNWYFDVLNRNEIEDRSIERHLPKTRTELTRLLEDAELRELQEFAETYTRERVEAVVVARSKSRKRTREPS